MKKRILGLLVAVIFTFGNLLGCSGGYDFKSIRFSSNDFKATKGTAINDKSNNQSDAANREKLDFNRGWKFARKNIAEAISVDYPIEQLERWESVSLPHTVREESYNNSGGLNYQGAAMYRKHFMLDSSYVGKNLFVEFEGIMGVTDVWVNGNHLQTPMAKLSGNNSHYGGYLPIVLDITRAVHCDGDTNVITVLTDNSNNSNVPPGKPQEDLDFTYFGGIYRNAWLHAVESVYITNANYENIVAGGGVSVNYSDVSHSSATVEIKTHVRNSSSAAKKVTLRSEISDSAKVIVGSVSSEVTIAANSAETFSHTITIANPKLWSIDNPNMHTLSSKVIVGEDELDDLKTAIGIRTIAMSPQTGILLNGAPIGFLTGVNRHQEYAYIGNAASASLQRRDAILYKSAGFNIVRTAHHPQSIDFLDACDELGIMVIESVPGWQHWSNDLVFAQRVKMDIQQMIRRDRNRPSILTFETSLNEVPEAPPTFTNECESVAKLEHPSLKTSAENHHVGAQGDILYGTPSEVAGWSSTALSLIREYGDHWEEQFGDDSQKDFCRVTRSPGGFYPGGEAAMVLQGNNRLYNGYTFDGTGAISLSEGLEHYKDSPRFVGMTMWIGIDHNRGGNETMSPCGLWDLMRIPKYSYYAFASQRSAVSNAELKKKGVETGEILFIADSWGKTAPIVDKKGYKIGTDSEREINIYSNADKVKLSVIGSDNSVLWSRTNTPINVDTSSNLEHPPFLFSKVPYTAGSHLVAEGFNAAGEAMDLKEEKHTAGEAAKLKLEIDTSGQKIIADGADVFSAYAYVLDSDGNVCENASNRLTFSVTGGAEIVGDEDKRIGANPINAEAGVAGAMLRTSENPSEVTLTVSADGGITSAAVTFSTVASTVKGVAYQKIADGLPIDKVSSFLTDMEAFDPSTDARDFIKGIVNIDGIDYANSITVRNFTTLTYDLDGAYSRFTAKVALPSDAITADGAKFKVYLDGSLRFCSPTVSSQIENIELNVSNAKSMTIVVEDKNDLNCNSGVWLSPYLYEGNTPADESELRQNIALNAAATADNSDAGTNASNAVDGNLTTLWRSAQNVTSSNPQTFQLDLGKVMQVRNARLSVEHDYLKCTYDIYTSENGVDYFRKVSGSKTAHGNSIIDKFAAKARYVRVVFTKAESAQGDASALRASIKEFELFADKGVDSVNEYNLKGLNIAGKDIAFSPDVYNYTFDLNGYEKEFWVKVLACDPKASVSINGKTVAPNLASDISNVPYIKTELNGGNQIEITVTSLSGATKTYLVKALGKNEYNSFDSYNCSIQGENGANNWIYQRQNKASGKFTDLTADGYIQGEYAWGYGNDWLYSGTRYMHPSNEDNAVRTFIAPHGGMLLFTVSAKKYINQPGQIALSVLKNGFVIRKDCANVTLTDGQKDISVSVQVKTGDRIALVLDGYDGNGGDATCVTASAEYRNNTYLSDLNWEQATTGDGSVMRDSSRSGSAIELNDDKGSSVIYKKGIGTHAESEIIYDISGMDFNAFECYVGVDYSQKINANVEFIVSFNDVDNVVYSSGIMRFDTPQKHISLPIDSSVEKVYLTVTQGDNGNNYSDHGNWADAKFLHGSYPPVSEIAAGLTLEPLTEGQTQLLMPSVPNGYNITLTQSSIAAAISLGGVITPQQTETDVILTFTVTRADESATALLTVKVPKKATETPLPPPSDIDAPPAKLKPYAIVLISLGVAVAIAAPLVTLLVLRRKRGTKTDRK